MIYILALALCIAADQALKLWVVANLGLHESMPLLPGIVELYYIRNTGGGFSIMTGQTWLLAALTVVLMAVLGALIVKKVFTHPLAVWPLILIIGGGLGNLIDRVRLGYVVDMFNLEFMNYPVFNIADIFVVCGAFVFAFYYLVLHDKVTAQTQKKTEEAGDDGNDHAES